MILFNPHIKNKLVRSQTLIDIFFTSNPFSTVACIFTFDVSDHFSIFAIFDKFYEQENVKAKFNYRVINDDTLALFSHNLYKLDFTYLLTGLDLNASVAELDSLILKEYNIAYPTKYLLVGSQIVFIYEE